MKKFNQKFIPFLLSLILFLSLIGINVPVKAQPILATNVESIENTKAIINDFQGVANYIHTYNKLPDNFITKQEAKNLGWSPGKDLWNYAPNKSIGGDTFRNAEKKLPEKSGRSWRECDINYNGGSRGADRIVYSNDGLIYGTTDHYQTFILYYNGPQ
ncbi:ribonuclease domain-containing protein [Clostridium sp.]|uniref:ribonuclease domain-containing protein n=1 Tax=Clostridium sp. TaxID=1506 RepID=UPI0026141C07|nr:ribonuclease domain-containing protein [Clostridium sp.]